MVTIQHLEIRFDVEGEEDEQVFVDYFNKYIDRWSRQRDARGAITSAMDNNRALGDRGTKGRGR
jgi:hypothetical protein